jgi:hypothetical protein
MRATVLRSVGIALFAAFFAAAGSLSAQEEKVKPIPYWDTDVGVGIQYSVMCVGAMPPPGASHPWGVLIARVRASGDQNPLSDWKFVFEKALPLDQRYLDVIKDSRPLPDLQFRGLDELKGSDLGIYLALNNALHRADQANQEMFERSAADNKHVSFAALNKQPGEHRGKVVSVKGELAVIRKVPAPRLVKDEMDFVYTAYIKGPNKHIPPYTVVFTELPQGLEVGEEQHAVVTMHGYFLGLIRFQADKENRDVQKDVISPYLVGKTLVVNSKEPEKKAEEESHSYVLIVTVLTCFILMATFGAVALVWLRRGDRKIQSQLAQVRDKHSPFSLEPSEEAAPPPNPDMGFQDGTNPPP